jgi:hypothetical protein
MKLQLQGVYMLSAVMTEAVGLFETSVRDLRNSMLKCLPFKMYDKKEMYVYSNIYPTRCNVTQFILSGNCSTCFGWYHHLSSGAQTAVSTASGICHTVTM